MSALHFLRPLLFTTLVVLLPAVAFFWYTGFQLRRKSRKTYEDANVNKFSTPLRLAAEYSLLGAWAAIVTLLVVAAAGPVVPDAPTKVQEGSLQVVILSDVSRSMAAEDYRANMPPKDGVSPDLVTGPYGTRLDMAKLVVETQIMPAVTGNEIGIATYCGNGFNQADLTTDYKSLRWVLDNWMQIGAAPGGGSDYSEGLKAAMEIFANSPAPGRQKVIVWFTDGGYTGDPQALTDVIAKVQQAGIKVIIVGVGADSPSPIPVYDPTTGQLTGYMQKDSKTVTTSIDEPALNALASRMGATYIRLVPGQPLNIHWASTIAGSHTETHESQVFQYPLALAMVLMFGLFVRGLVPTRRQQ
jgi:Ca-activated chloride channel family protein